MTNFPPGAKRFGLLGGTFDPIHHGHLALAEAARAELELDLVLFVPARLQPHKAGCRVTAAEHRWEMVRRAVADNPGFAACRVELDREGPSYTAETVANLTADLPSDGQLYFICGADALLELHTWHQPDRLLAGATVAAAARPGAGARADLIVAAERLLRAYGGRVVLFEAPLLDISSTIIRQRAAAGKPLRYLTPAGVIDYIHNLCVYEKEIDQIC